MIILFEDLKNRSVGPVGPIAPPAGPVGPVGSIQQIYLVLQVSYWIFLIALSKQPI